VVLADIREAEGVRERVRALVELRRTPTRASLDLGTRAL
jgi:hypothetical protein